MLLQDFNALTAAEADAAVRPCVDIDAWVDAVVAGRPYDAVADLLALADAQARTWTPAEVEAALADHPRIGERHQGSGASAAMSGSEQAGVDPHDADVQRRLADGNRRTRSASTGSTWSAPPDAAPRRSSRCSRSG